MIRFSSLLTIGLSVVGLASAGTIVPVNLQTTSGTITCSVSIAGCNSGGTAFSNGGFVNSLFSSVIQAGAPSTSPNNQNLANPNNVPFILDGAGSGGTTGNAAYLSPNTANDTVTLQLDLGTYNGNSASYANGVFGVDQIWTLINANLEGAGYQGITVSLGGFNATGTQSITDTISLQSGRDYRNYSDISTAGGDTCTDANTTDSPGYTSCVGQTSPTAQTSGSESQTFGSFTNVVTTYNNAVLGNNGTNNFWLDAQNMNLGGAFVNGYLDTITITAVSPAGKQRTLFSGLSLDTVATPEPGTIALLFGGLGLLGFGKWRGKKAVKG